MGFFSDVLGALTGGSQRDAGEASARAAERGVAENRRQFDVATQLTAPTRNFQNQSQLMLSQLLGLSPYDPNAGAPNAVGGAGGGNNSRFGGYGGRFGDYQNRFNSEPDIPLTSGTGGGDLTGGLQPGGSITDILRATPGYQFNVDETIRNANVGAAGRGEFFSGAAGDELNNRLHGLADQTYGNQVNRLLASANGGSSAANTANQSIQTGQLAAQGIQNAGDARASGILGQSNTIGNIVNGAIRVFGGR